VQDDILVAKISSCVKFYARINKIQFLVMSTQTSINEVVNITTTNNISILSMITSSDMIGKSVMLMLVIASIWSWAIIIDKIFSFYKVKKKIIVFEAQFWSGGILEQLYDSVKKSVNDPASSIFVSAMNECKRHKNTIPATDSLKMGRKERVLQTMYLVRNREIERLEQNLGFLATVGSSTPFVGLLGTVWGIMHSFQSIASSKNTSLAVVAPGIAEALLATAIGLFAAIPAVIFYNYLSAQLVSINNKIDDFIGELNTILSRAIDEEKI
jgi:biopolymer transport protein TolQ